LKTRVLCACSWDGECLVVLLGEPATARVVVLQVSLCVSQGAPLCVTELDWPQACWLHASPGHWVARPQHSSV
jgi:hypothetical protein